MKLNKKYKCSECGMEVPILSKGKCKYCRYKERKGNGELPKYHNRMKRAPLKRKDFKSTEKNLELKQFFTKHINKLKKTPRSEESNEYISNPSHWNVCHILDKARHKSVQCLDENVVYLTIEEHSSFDNWLYKHEFEKIKLNFPNIWMKEIKNLPKILEVCKENTKFVEKLRESAYKVK